MSDQLERIEFISTVLIIRLLEKVQVDDQHPLSSSRIMKPSGRDLDTESNFASCKKMSKILLQFNSAENERRTSE